MNVGVGCVGLGSASASSSAADQRALVHRSLDAGLTTFDTADVYGSGASERLLGAALKGRRDEATISTKGGYVFRPQSRGERTLRRAAVIARRATESARTTLRRRAPGDDDHGDGSSGADPDVASGGEQVAPRATYQEQDFRPEHLRRSVDESLRRLGTDHVDVYQLHGPPPTADDVADEVLGCLAELRTAGKVRRIGVGAESIESAVAWARRPPVDVVQLPFGVMDPFTVDEVAPVFAGRDGGEIWARGVLGGGVMAASLRGEPLADHPKADLVARLGDIASAAGLRLDELAVRWVTANESIGTMLLGMSSTGHLERNLRILDGPPLDDDVLDAVRREIGSSGSGDTAS